MSEQKYYPEDILVEKMENGEYGWLDYVNHYSAEWHTITSTYFQQRHTLKFAHKSLITHNPS